MVEFISSVTLRIRQHYVLLSVFGIFLFLFLISKILFLVLLFVALDIIKNIIELKLYLNYFPIKFIEIGIITISYLFGFEIGVILVIFYLINKLIFLKFDDRALTSLPSLLIVSSLADILSNFNYVIVAVCLFVLRYILDFVFSVFLINNIRLNNFPARIVNSVFAYFMFNLIYLII